MDSILFLVILAVYFAPTIIAVIREHHYRWVILGLNIFGIAGLPWFIAFIWAVFPSEKSLIDPVLGNPTGKTRRNVGDTWGNVTHGVNRGAEEEAQHGTPSHTLPPKDL